MQSTDTHYTNSWWTPFSPLWQLKRYLQQEQNGKLMSTNSTVLLQPVQLAITRFEATTPAWLELLWAHLFFFVYPLLPLQLFHILNGYGALMSTDTFGT